LLAALIFKEIRGIEYRTQLAQTLAEEKQWLPILGLKKPPAHDAFHDFIKRVGSERLHRIFLWLVEKIRTRYPRLARLLAIDSTVIKAYCSKHRRKKSDPDARWGRSFKDRKHPERVYGYKITVAVATNKELPVEYEITPAPESDQIIYPRILKKAKDAGNLFHYVTADAGFDRKMNIIYTMKLGGSPVIALNPRSAKDRTGRRATTRRADYILTVKRHSTKWKKIYAKRPAAERVFSRLEKTFGLERLRVRTMERVRCHFAICMISMLSLAVAATRSGLPELCRSLEPWRYKR
jgi:transposase